MCAREHCSYVGRTGRQWHQQGRVQNLITTKEGNSIFSTGLMFLVALFEREDWQEHQEMVLLLKQNSCGNLKVKIFFTSLSLKSKKKLPPEIQGTPLLGLKRNCKVFSWFLF